MSPVISDKHSALTVGDGDSVPDALGSNSSTSDQAFMNQKFLQQLNALGQRLEGIEINTLSSAGNKPKVGAQATKSKCQNKTKTHVQLSLGRSDVNDAPVTQRRGYVLSPDRLKHELNIQEQVQERLRHLAEKPSQISQKFSPRGVDPLRYMFPTGSGGPMSLSWLVKMRSLIINYPPSSGWLVFAEPSARRQI